MIYKKRKFIYYKLLINFLIFILISNGCTHYNHFVYSQNINQGNYLSKKDIEVIKIGMSDQEVIYILGSPMLIDPFGSQTWFYVFRQKISYNNVNQKLLILIFDNKGFLINIKKINI